VTQPRPRYLTVRLAADDLGVSTDTVHRAIRSTTNDVIPRDRVRLPAGRNGRMMLQNIVEVGALGRHLDGLQPGPRPTT
jgi:predicted DNA-binding transcriptional regulator YafY